MKIWTIQPQGFLTTLESAGKVTARCPVDLDRETLAAYKWLSKQIKKRLGLSCTWPIWAWHAYAGTKRRRPDLRNTWLLPTGTHGVRIECEVEQSIVLLSEFEKWTWVLSDKYVPLDFSDCERAESLALQGKLSVGTKRKSWERIFDLGSGCETFWQQTAERAIQACVPRIQYDEVVKVDHFIAR